MASDPIILLTEDHRAVDVLFGNLETASGADEKQRIATQIVRDLTQHMDIEERSFYPAARSALPDQASEIDDGEHEHAELRGTLEQLDGLAGDDARFDELIASARQQVGHHVADEEEKLFPEVRGALSADQLAEIGDALVAEKGGTGGGA